MVIAKGLAKISQSSSVHEANLGRACGVGADKHMDPTLIMFGEHGSSQDSLTQPIKHGDQHLHCLVRRSKSIAFKCYWMPISSESFLC